MKVLLIGRNELIAEALIRGFLIEKDKIMLIGSFDEKKIDSLLMEKIHHHQVDIASDKCEDIFIVNNPDVVVYFDNIIEDANHYMTENQRLDHINNLINAHYYAVKAKVSRFIYISSIKAADHLNQENPEWCRAHSSCELYLKDFDTHETTKCVILRASQLYGYGREDKDNIIVKLVRNNIYKKTDNYTDMDKLYDFVHIDDFCAGVRRSVQVFKSYTFNISSGYKIPLDIINKTIENIKWVEDDFIESSKVPGEDISVATTLIGYTPNIDLLEGIREVYNAEMEYKRTLDGGNLSDKIKKIFTKIKRGSQKRVNITNYLVNIMLGLLVVFFITRGYTDVAGIIDIKLLYLFIVVLFFDFRQALLAVLFAVAITVYQFVQIEDSLILVLYNPQLTENIFLLTVAGLGGGIVRQESIDRLKKYERNEVSLRDQLSHVKTMYYDSLVVKDSLQGQIYNSNNSFGRVFNVMSQMESLDLTELQYQIIQFTEEIMQNKYISFYILNRSSKYLRLVSKSEALHDLPVTIVVSEDEVAQQIIKTEKMYSNKQIDKDTGVVMAAPMFYGNRVVAILYMNKANIEDLTLSYSNMFEITANLANQSFNKAYAYHNAKEDELYVEGTEVLKEEAFAERLRIINEQVMEHKTSAALLDIGTRKGKKYFEKIRALVRETDYIGLSPTGNVLILLSGISKEDVVFVQNRLKNNGVESQVLDVSGWNLS